MSTASHGWLLSCVFFRMSTSKAKSTPRQSARKSKEKRPSTDELVLQLMQKVDDYQAKNDKRFEALEQQKAPNVDGNEEALVVSDQRTTDVADKQGEPPSTEPTLTHTPTIIGVPIAVGSNLKPAIVAAIAEGRFVNFRDLLPSHTHDPSDNLSGNLGVGERGEVLYKPLPKKAKEERDLTWDQWVQAFVIFMGLTVKTRSAETALHMAKHFELVHELMKAKQDFWYYDVAFRQTLATGGGHWGDIHSESLARARARATPPLHTGISSASTSAPTKVNGRSSQYTVPVGWCGSYHKYGLCIYPGSCSRKHDCHVCGRDHPALECRGKDSSVIRATQSSATPPYKQLINANGKQQPFRVHSVPSYPRGNELKLDRRPAQPGATSRPY